MIRLIRFRSKIESKCIANQAGPSPVQSCKSGNAKLFKDRNGPGSKSIGPGHPAIFKYTDAAEKEQKVFSNHYYRDVSYPGHGFVSFVEHHEITYENGWPKLGQRWNPMDFWNKDQTTTTTTTPTTQPPSESSSRKSFQRK